MSESVPPRPSPKVSEKTGSQPAALKWVTTPLLVMVVLNALLLLATPLSSEAFYPLVKASLDELGMQQALTPQFMQMFIWTIFFMFMISTALVYFVWEGAKAGRRWAWIASMLVGVLALLAFPPISTVIGIALLFGVFQPSVRAYYNSAQTNTIDKNIQ